MLTGALPSPAHELAEIPAFGDSRLLAGVGTALDPKPIDLFHLHRPRRQQRNNCVAHANMNVLQVLFWILNGAPPVAPENGLIFALQSPELSVDWPYAGAQHLRTPGVFLDKGSQQTLMGKFIRDHGVVREDVYPETGTNGVQIPDARIWRRASGARVVKTMHRLAEGSDAPAQVAAALAVAAAGGASPPSIVVTADEAMGAVPDGGTYDGPGGAILGGHALAILGCDPKRGVRVADTWGRVSFWFTWDYVANYGREMLVTEAAPLAPVI